MSVARTSAHDYDPLGDDEEHPGEARLAVDRDPGTAWTTETYRDGLEGTGKEGVGIYVDAEPGVDATALQIDTPEPGWKVAGAASPTDEPARRDRRLGRAWPAGRCAAASSASSCPGDRHRYYLVWITELPRRTPTASRSPRSASSLRGARRR